MFQPSQADVRRFFCGVRSKMQAQAPMAAIETLASLSIAEHPEYFAELDAVEADIARNYDLEPGRTNPFLHLSMHLSISEQRTIVGRLQREIERKIATGASAIGQAVRQALAQTLSKAARIVAQSGQRKAVDGQPKLYAWHAPEVDCISKGKAKRISEQERKLLRRRQAIEPIIGHLKADHRMGRCHLKGEQGDRLHAVLCAAGYNIKWLLRMIASKGVTFLTTILLCLQQASTQGRSWLAAVMGMRSWAADGRSTLANRLTFGAGRLSQA